MTDLSKTLTNFCRLDHVQGAAVLDNNGYIIEQHFLDERDTSPLAEVVLRSLHAGTQLAEDLGKAPLNQQYIEFEDQQLTAELLSSGYVLVIWAGSGANLGRVRLEIRKNKGALERMLAV